MATFKKKMRYLEPNWADCVWDEVKNRIGGRGDALAKGIAALALTGARPISLERGIVFRIGRDNHDIEYLEAFFYGAKILKNEDGSARRGQEAIQIKWRVTDPACTSHRPREFAAILNAVRASPDKRIAVMGDAEAISQRLREISRRIWPRKRIHISGICYRELLAATAKAAGMTRTEIAAAMGHLSEESQGKYMTGRNVGGWAVRPFTSARAAHKTKAVPQGKQDALARFKSMSTSKKPT